MVMKARNVISYGSTLVTVNNSQGMTSIVRQNLIGEQHILRNIVSGKGPDRVTVRAHHYEKITKLGLKGFRRTWTPGTPNWTEESGIVGGVYEIPLDVLSDNDVAYNAALEKLQGKLRHDVDLSIDLLQSPQSKKMVTSWIKGAKTLVKTAREIKRMPLKMASSAYLQYIYGVAPTMSTIFGAMEAFADTSNGSFKVWGTGRFENHVLRKTMIDYAPAELKIDLQHRVKIGCTYRRPSELMTHISNYTSLNPASITYELIPFSFVLDWFYDVGSWLRGLESAYVLSPFMSHAYVSTGVKADMAVIQKYSEIQPSVGVVRSGAGATSYVRFTRSPSPSLILPRKPVFPSFAGVKEGVLDHTMQSLALTRSVARSLDKSRFLR